MRARSSMPDHSHVLKRKTFGSDCAIVDALREGEKKNAGKSEKAFLGIEKYMRFPATTRSRPLKN
jgi:hypothetical protein